MRRASSRAGSATLIYDDDCGICVASMEWLGRRVPECRLRYLPLTDAAADPALGSRVAHLDLRASLHLVTADGRILTGAAASLGAGRLVPRWAILARLFDQPLGRALLEPVYRQIARNRRAIGRRLGLPDSCRLPTPEPASEVERTRSH